MKELANKRHEHHKAEEAVDNRGDAGKKLNAGRHDTLNARAGKARKIHGAKKTGRNSDNKRPERCVDAAQDHRQNAERLACWAPYGSRKELDHADFSNSGHTACEEEDAYQGHCEDRNPRSSREKHLRERLFDAFHNV